MQRVARMKREMQLFEKNPPHGVSCWSKEDSLEQLEAQLVGPEGTPYEGGVFKLEIQIPERIALVLSSDRVHMMGKDVNTYPFEPPKMRFDTPVYHPNIDNAGRICLDSLKMPPKGAWKPALNISTLLTSILLLLSEPNPDDPLMADISNEFRYNKATFEEKAREWTKKYACSSTAPSKTKAATSENVTPDLSSKDSTSNCTSNTASAAGLKRDSEQTSLLQENVTRSKS